jgi:hypothetical protein
LIISRGAAPDMRNAIIIMIIPNLLTMLIGSALTPHTPTVSTASVRQTGFTHEHTTNTENTNE